jgi:hypothetical protein
MYKTILIIVLSFFINQVFTQNTSTSMSLDSLVLEMQKITEEEKSQLMARLVMIDEKVRLGELNVNDALDIKLLETDVTNLRIKRRMAFYEQQIKDVINAQLSGEDFDLALANQQYVSPEMTTNEKPQIEKVYGERYSSSNSPKAETLPKEVRTYKESRYIDQVVLGFGVNTLLNNGNTSNLSDTDVNIIQSRNYEFGLAWKYRIIENSNLLMLRYGISYYRAHLSPRNELIFVKDGNITNLLRPTDEVISNKFTNNYFIAPIHLELDFSQKYTAKKSGHSYLRSQRSFRVGVGAYIGILASSRQNTTFLINNRTSKTNIKGDYNVSQIIYGTEAYVGFKDMSVRLKYDISELFSQNPNQQNVASLGLRWDLK